MSDDRMSARQRAEMAWQLLCQTDDPDEREELRRVWWALLDEADGETAQ